MHCVAVLGSSSLSEEDPLFQTFQEIGRLIAEQGLCVISHGTSGVAEAVSSGARGIPEAIITGFTMADELGNRHLTQQHDSCRVPLSPAMTEIWAGIRLGRLLAASGFIFGPPTDPRTFSELLTAIAWNADQRVVSRPKRVAVLRDTHDWWVDQLQGLRTFLCFDNVLIVDTAREAVDWATEASIRTPEPATA
jgi:hypothetical protein